MHLIIFEKIARRKGKTYGPGTYDHGLLTEMTETIKPKQTMNIKEIKEKVKNFLVEEMEIDESSIQDNALLKEDMGIDSLEVVDIVVLVDQEFGFKMKPEDFKELLTLDQFCQFIAQRVG